MQQKYIYLYPNISIFQWNYTIAQVRFLVLNKRIIKCTPMESLEIKYCVVGMGD